MKIIAAKSILLALLTTVAAQDWNQWNAPTEAPTAWGWNAPPTDPPTNKPTEWPTAWPTPWPTTGRPTQWPTKWPTPWPTEGAGEVGGLDCSQFTDSFTYDTIPITVNYVVTLDEGSPNRGIFSAEVIYEGQGWVGLGFSPTGAMVPSLAVIGLPDEGVSQTNPGKYNLAARSAAGVTLADPATQTILNGNIQQNSTHTVLTFQKYLEEDGELSLDPQGSNFIIAAAGSSNTLGYHLHRASTSLTFSPCVEGAEAVTDAPTKTPTDAPTSVVINEVPEPPLADDNENADAGEGLDCSQFVDSFAYDTIPITVNYVVTVDEDSPNGGLFSAEVIYEGQGWVGLGFSETGAMVPSLAVIGLPDEGISQSNPGKYNLVSRSEAGVTLADPATQTILNGNIQQNATHTILTFQKYLEEEGEISIDPTGSNFIVAAAGSGNDLAYHLHRASTSVSFSPCVDGADPADRPTNAPTPAVEDVTEAPVDDAATNPPADGEGLDCSQFQFSHEFDTIPVTMNYVVTLDEESPNKGLFSAEVIYEGQGWVGFGISQEGLMVPSLAVIGLPDEDISASNPGKYDLTSRSLSGVSLTDAQTILNGDIQQNETHTVMRFQKLLEEDGEIAINPEGVNIFLAAAGSGNNLAIHQHRASVGLSLVPCVDGADPDSVINANPVVDIDIDNKQSLFTGHALMAGIAWGILAPLAISNSLCRHLIPKAGFWFQLHRGFNVMVLLMTIIAFSLAYAAVEALNGTHFESSEGALYKHKTIGLVVFILTIVQALGGILRPHVPEAGEKKSIVRTIWEYGHKGSGYIILAMAWYQCHSGLVLYSRRFERDDDHVGIFWAIAGTIFAIGVGGKIHGLFFYQAPEAKKDDVVVDVEKPASDRVSEEPTVSQEPTGNGTKANGMTEIDI